MSGWSCKLCRLEPFLFLARSVWLLRDRTESYCFYLFSYILLVQTVNWKQGFHCLNVYFYPTWVWRRPLVVFLSLYFIFHSLTEHNTNTITKLYKSKAPAIRGALLDSRSMGLVTPCFIDEFTRVLVLKCYEIFKSEKPYRNERIWFMHKRRHTLCNFIIPNTSQIPENKMYIQL